MQMAHDEAVLLHEGDAVAQAWACGAMVPLLNSGDAALARRDLVIASSPENIRELVALTKGANVELLVHPAVVDHRDSHAGAKIPRRPLR